MYFSPKNQKDREKIPATVRSEVHFFFRKAGQTIFLILHFCIFRQN